jgi:hypothetical protein
MRATERKREGLRTILYDPKDLPSPTFAGGVLWVALFFLPLPLMLLVHWWLRQQPSTDLWLTLLNALTGWDWRMGVIASLTFTGCCGLVYAALRFLAEPKVTELVQSVTDSAGLENWQRQLFWVAPIVFTPLLLLRKMGAIELALLSGAEIALWSARKIQRFPEEPVELVPVDLQMEVERLRSLQGELVAYEWTFQPEPYEPAESLSLQIAFNPERLEQARQRPHERKTDGDWHRFAAADLTTPEILALAQQLHELHEDRRWTPFQRCQNVLALLAHFESDDEGELPRFAIETLYEKRGTANDLVLAAFTLLKALKETVPEVVLVLSGDRTKAGLGIAGAEDFPEQFQGFRHGGRTFFFAYPERQNAAWRWHIGALTGEWQPITILSVGGR